VGRAGKGKGGMAKLASGKNKRSKTRGIRKEGVGKIKKGCGCRHFLCAIFWQNFAQGRKRQVKERRRRDGRRGVAKAARRERTWKEKLRRMQKWTSVVRSKFQLNWYLMSLLQGKNCQNTLNIALWPSFEICRTPVLTLRHWSQPNLAHTIIPKVYALDVKFQFNWFRRNYFSLR